MSGDPGVNPGEALATVNDGAAYSGPLLVNGPDGAAEHGEGEVGFVERAEQRTVLELLLDVGVDITGGQTGGGEVEGGVPGVWWRNEGNIPPKREVFEKFGTVKVGT